MVDRLFDIGLIIENFNHIMITIMVIIMMMM